MRDALRFLAVEVDSLFSRLYRPGAHRLPIEQGGGPRCGRPHRRAIGTGPGLRDGLLYDRPHGSPKMDDSAYPDVFLDAMASGSSCRDSTRRS